MIRLIILIVIIIAVLSYFNFDFRTFFGSDIVKNNFGFAWNWTVYVWDNYLSVPANYLWNLFVDKIWNSFLENLDRFKAGQGSTLKSPGVPNQ
jgi:hypothetical protein